MSSPCCLSGWRSTSPGLLLSLLLASLPLVLPQPIHLSRILRWPPDSVFSCLTLLWLSVSLPWVKYKHLSLAPSLLHVQPSAPHSLSLSFPAHLPVTHSRTLRYWPLGTILFPDFLFLFSLCLLPATAPLPFLSFSAIYLNFSAQLRYLVP